MTEAMSPPSLGGGPDAAHLIVDRDGPVAFARGTGGQSGRRVGTPVPPSPSQMTPPLAVQLARDAPLKAFATTLETGLEYERRNFTLCFATGDCRKGLAAFLEKRAPEVMGR